MTGKTRAPRIAGAAVTVLAAVLVASEFSGRAAFATASTAYRGSSEVNAALVTGIARDLAKDADPAEISRMLSAALTRQDAASAAVTDAMPAWWRALPERPERRFAAAAGRESAALRGIAAAIDRMAASPKEEWNGAILALREGMATFADAHQEIARWGEGTRGK